MSETKWWAWRWPEGEPRTWQRFVFEWVAVLAVCAVVIGGGMLVSGAV